LITILLVAMNRYPDEYNAKSKPVVQTAFIIDWLKQVSTPAV